MKAAGYADWGQSSRGDPWMGRFLGITPCNHPAKTPGW